MGVDRTPGVAGVFAAAAWFAGKARELRAVRLADTARPEGFPSSSFLALMAAEFETPARATRRAPRGERGRSVDPARGWATSGRRVSARPAWSAPVSRGPARRSCPGCSRSAPRGRAPSFSSSMTAPMFIAVPGVWSNKNALSSGLRKFVIGRCCQSHPRRVRRAELLDEAKRRRGHREHDRWAMRSPLCTTG